MQLRYKNRTLRNIKRPSIPSMSFQNTWFEINEYKCLHSGNCYHPFGTPHLTTTAFAYRSTTILKHTPYWNSAAFGYPARRHKLGVKPIKLTTTKPPFVVPAELIAEQEPIRYNPRFSGACIVQAIAAKYLKQFKKDDQGEYWHLFYFL